MDDAEALEQARLAAVSSYRLHDQPPKPFGRLVALAARLLDAPFATVSIVDAERVRVKAAYGWEGVTTRERAEGFCASAILQDTPYAVPDAATDPRTAGNPLVRGERGIRCYAAAPIIAPDGHRLGTVDVYGTRPRSFTAAELSTLEDLAAVVMDTLELTVSALRTAGHERELRRYREQDVATIEGFASTLQRTLLPPSLPTVPGLELACHYYAASPQDVTGDFYDVFGLGDDRWAFFLGDVSGHGAPAATVTSLARYTLRAAALHNSDPAAALAELNSALLLDPQVRQCCTVLFGVLRPLAAGGVEIVLAGGGHPPALWLRPDADGGAVEDVWPQGGMLLGALPDATFATSRLRLEPGETLLLYTDGLTEARPGGEFFGEHGLRDFAARHVHRTAAGLIAEIKGLIESFEPAPSDDVALLALSAPPRESATAGEGTARPAAEDGTAGQPPAGD